MNLIILAFSFLLAHHNTSQTQSSFDHTLIIDSMVWEPFKKAYLEKDGALYVSIHTEDILRVTPWGISQGLEWRNKMLSKFAEKSRKVCVIDFVFEHRIHEEDIAYEVGYYQLYYIPKTKDSEMHYGRFHVVLKKQGGQWKIAQDWDSNTINGHKISPKDFDKIKEGLRH